MAADQLSRVFGTLADPTRRDIVARLAVGDATVGELAEPYDVSIQAVSKHLKVLTDAGLVSQTRDGQRRPCHLEAEVFDLMTKWIERYRRQAEERYDRLDAVLAEMRGDEQPIHTDEADDARSQHRERHQQPLPGLDRGRRQGARSSASPATSTPPRRSCSGPTPTPSCSPAGSGPTAWRPRSSTGTPRPAAAGATSRWRDGEEFGFHGCFHEVGEDRIVQTFTYDGQPDGVALETLRFEDLGDGRTRLHAQSLVDTFEARDQWLASGMEIGVDDGYAKLDGLLAASSDERPGRRAPAHRGRVHRRPPRASRPRPGTSRRRWRGGLRATSSATSSSGSPPFLRGGAGITLPAGPSVDDDPVGAWRTQTDAVQALLDDTDAADREHDFPHIGRMPLGQAIDMIYTSDVFMHRWDLARATGQDETLDPGKCAAMLEGMLPMDDVLRQSGQYGPRVHVPDDADVQSQLLAFIGRTP